MMEPIHNFAPCMVFVSTDEGVLADMNEAALRLLGYQKTELIGQKIDVIFTLSTRIFQQTHFFPLLKIQGHAEEIYITLQTKEKESLPVLINATRIITDGKALITYAGIVVHNRKKFEDELVAAKMAAETSLRENTALQQAKKDLQKHAELLDQQMYLVKKNNEELRQFNHVVTHELQEPLRKLFLFTSMVLETGDTETNTKTAQKIKSVSEQMRSTLSGLQQYVWLTETPVKSTEIDLNQLVSAIMKQLEKENSDTTIDLQMEDLPLVMADKEQFSLLFREILTNAVRFRKPEKNVIIQISSSRLQQNKFKTVEDKYEYIEFLRIQVKDNGIGFDAAYKEQVFELFKRLHKGGRGIGLSLCKKIIENHKGSISIDSFVNEGTIVTLILPVHDPESITTNANIEKHHIKS